MPCVLPILGIKVVHIIESNNGKSPWLSSIIFSLGILSSLWLMALSVILLRGAGEEVGWGFQLQDPLFVIILGAVFLIFALNLLGLFEWSLPSNAAMKATRWSNIKGPVGSFFSGVFLTFLATPCSAPFMGSAIGVSFTMDSSHTFAIFTALGLGLASPYLLLASFPTLQKLIPKPGAWMETFKKLSGFVLLGTLIYLLWVLDGLAKEWVMISLVWYWLLSISIWLLGKYGSFYEGLGKRLFWRSLVIALIALGIYEIKQVEISDNFNSSIEQNSEWQPYSKELIESLKAENKNVFINFTARWCWTCQINKKTVLASEEVKAFFKKNQVSLVEADWTQRNPAITEALAYYNRASVPTYIFINSNGKENILSEVLTLSDLESILK